MDSEVKPYTAIPGYMDKTPQELSAPHERMTFYPHFTDITRLLVQETVISVSIDESDLARYRSVGPAIIVPNHRSLRDIPVIATLGKRSGEGQPFFLSKRENMNNLVSSRILGHMRTFPIDRDMQDPRWLTVLGKWGRFALGDDVEAGEQSKKLVIFGEGTRKKGPVVEGVKVGPLVLARKMKVPILPVGIAGTQRVGLRNIWPRVFITVGEPYAVESVRDIVTLTAKMQQQFDRAKELRRANSIFLTAKH